MAKILINWIGLPFFFSGSYQTYFPLACIAQAQSHLNIHRIARLHICKYKGMLFFVCAFLNMLDHLEPLFCNVLQPFRVHSSLKASSIFDGTHRGWHGKHSPNKRKKKAHVLMYSIHNLCRFVVSMGRFRLSLFFSLSLFFFLHAVKVSLV